jgi:hypothetical protein
MSFCTFKAESVININKELNHQDIPPNPYNEAHESTPYAISAFTSEIVAMINVTSMIDGMDLLHLPSLVHWHALIGLRHIRFP